MLFFYHIIITSVYIKVKRKKLIDFPEFIVYNKYIIMLYVKGLDF